MKKSNEKEKRKIKKRKKLKPKRAWEVSEFNIIEVLSIVIISIIFGVMIGCLITYKKDPISGKEISKELQDFIAVYDNIKENYYDDIDDDELINSAIKGMMSSLDDPYSLYMDDNDTADFNQSVDGSYVGIGASVSVDNVIVEVYEGFGADAAGLKVNDVIIEVDGKDVRDIHSDDLVVLIKGKKNTTVNIKVLRDGNELSFKVKRSLVEVASAVSRVISKNDKRIGLLTITSFAANTYKQVKKEINNLEKLKIKSLIIDVRDNPGGHLTQVADILDIFFDKKTVLYQLESKGKKKKIYADDATKKSYPIAILTNSNSASAAEILVSCFKENYKDAVVVGEVTYGKGTVQKAIELDNGSSIKYTSQKWLTSKGKWINEKGIEPDYGLELTDEYYNNPSDETDSQLQKALEILAEK